jgi:hypothetical protein
VPDASTESEDAFETTDRFDPAGHRPDNATIVSMPHCVDVQGALMAGTPSTGKQTCGKSTIAS